LAGHRRGVPSECKSGPRHSGGFNDHSAARQTGLPSTTPNWLAKLYENIVAWKLEQVWPKERILAEYLNRSSFGNRRLGPEAAARAYFGKSARELTLAESVYLAGLPQAPTRFNPWRHPDRADRKYARSLELLAKTGLLTGSQRNLLTGIPPIPEHFDPLHIAPHYVDAIVRHQPSRREGAHYARSRSPATG